MSQFRHFSTPPADLLNRLLKEAGDVDKARAAQAPLTSAQAQSFARLTLHVINHIEFHLDERPALDAPGRRRIARAWGVVYVNDNGTLNEEPEPAPAPAAP